jgi:hypothetical protein
MGREEEDAFAFFESPADVFFSVECQELLPPSFSQVHPFQVIGDHLAKTFKGVPGDVATLIWGKLLAKGSIEISQGQVAVLFICVEEQNPQDRSYGKAKPSRQKEKEPAEKAEKAVCC